METILGIRGPDFVMVAADTTQARSIIVMKEGMSFERLSNNNDFTIFVFARSLIQFFLIYLR